MSLRQLPIFQKNKPEPAAISVGMWKSGHLAIFFSLNNLFLSHNNENVRGGEWNGME